MRRLIIGCLWLWIAVACRTAKEPAQQTPALTDQQTVVYKTTKDFSNLVPIIMNAEKTEIVSYPAPSDLFYEGKLATPTPLKKGYLLDNRGINENVVFLNYTYQAYAELKEAPPMKELLARIADKYPLLELYYCGRRAQFRNGIADLNTLIDAGFPNCKKAKIIPMQIAF